MDRLSEVLAPANDNGFRVPFVGLTLNDDSTAPEINAFGTEDSYEVPEPPDQKDPVELLFVRINSAGTPLAGEELIYSLLKSAWVGAPDFIEQQLCHRPAQPSRVAILCIRLVMARQQLTASGRGKRADRYRLPGAPGVDEFRRLVRNGNPAHPKFLSELQDAIETDLHSRSDCYRLER